MANITPTYWTDLMRKKRPHLAKKKVIFHPDNAGVHTCVVSMAKFHELGYELLPHPPYSPDLAPDGLAERDFIPTMKSCHKQIHILRTTRNLIFCKGYKNWRNVARSL